MKNLQNRIRLLSLLSIFFIYRAIIYYLERKTDLFSIWLMIGIVYIISILIMQFIAQRLEKNQKKISNEK